MNMRDRQCRTCGVTFKGGPRAWYCPNCRLERQRAASREGKRRERAGLTRKLGSTDKCRYCGKDYEVTGGLQTMCEDCKPERYAEIDRKQSLEYYDKNKEDINPARSERRRLPPKICEWCNAEFDPGNKSLTCSDSCRVSLRNFK